MNILFKKRLNIVLSTYNSYINSNMVLKDGTVSYGFKLHDKYYNIVKVHGGYNIGLLKNDNN